MANYENKLTVMGSRLRLWRFDRVFRREMTDIAAQRQTPFRKAAEHPYSFTRKRNKPCYKQYGFCTCYIPSEYIRCLSIQFPSLVFNLTFDINWDVMDEGFVATGLERNGDITLMGGETVCGYFTFEPINRYPAWDYDPKPEENQTNTKEAA